jgi:membrane-bound lytic murein transglycosylase D
MNRWLKYLLYTTPLLFLVLLLTFSGIIHQQYPINQPSDSGRYNVYNVSLPSKLSFAGEEVPLQNFDVRESLDRELLVNVYWQSQTLFLIKRANRFFPVIEPILAAYNVPDDFKYLAVAESGLQNAVSPSEAAGFWQFLKPAAKECGLEINESVDERYHLEKSTEAACIFLIKAHEKFGSWAMAAASYNAGMNGMNQFITKQKQNNYYNLYLLDETARYVYRILAFKLILEAPGKYGFNIDKKDLFVPFEYSEVQIDSSITNIADFAESLGTNYKMLKLFNPWLRDVSLINKHRKKYSIKIPKQGYRETLCIEN